MKIGIVVAMDKELGLLLESIGPHSTITINANKFYVGHIGRHEIIAMKCGIGKVNAAVSTITLTENFHPALIINTGVAGGTGRGAGVGDVVVGDRVAYHDCWCGPGTEWGQAADCPRYFESAEPVVSLPCLSGNPRIHHGLIASGDIFVSRAEDIERILALYPDALGVDMESGAVAQVCHLKGVPFCVVRVVSDTPGSADNAAQYDNFWNDAPRSTFGVINEILSNI